MKKTSLFILIFSILLLPSHADIIYPDGTTGDMSINPSGVPKAMHKLARGIGNIAFSLVEIPRTVFDSTYDTGVFDLRPFTSGLFTLGPYRVVQRLRSGVYDIATALDNDKTLVHLEPEFIGFADMLPGYNQQFEWDSISSPAGSPSMRF
jgi:putative exosortase-associated protein (TIGR04073 family)